MFPTTVPNGENRGFRFPSHVQAPSTTRHGPRYQDTTPSQAATSSTFTTYTSATANSLGLINDTGYGTTPVPAGTGLTGRLDLTSLWDPLPTTSRSILSNSQLQQNVPATSSHDLAFNYMPMIGDTTSITRSQQRSSNSQSTPSPRPRSAQRMNVFSEAEMDKLRTLSTLLGQLHTDLAGCRRIQRGSPGAGSLSMSMTGSKNEFNRLKPEIEAILSRNMDISSGIVKLMTQFNQFDGVVNEMVNERGYDDGYTDRVRYLERINYECGLLKGMLDIILEGGILSSPSPGSGGSGLARTLTFDDGEELLGIRFEDDLETILSNDTDYQHGNISISVTLTTNLCSNMLKLLEDDVSTDVTLCVGSKRLRAHRVILAAQSEYFNSLLLGSMKESRDKSQVVLKDISFATLQLLIRFAYCGSIQLTNISLQGVLRLLEAADRFSFLRLKEAMVGQLSTLISVKTVIPLLLSADSLNLTGLKESCLQVTDKNAVTLLQSDALMTMPCDLLAQILNRDTFVVNESLILNAVVRWKSQNNVLQCASLVECVRLTQIPQQKLVDLSEREEVLFSSDKILKALKVQIKPHWEKMRPRGKKESKNLFKLQTCAKIKNTVAWKSCNGEPTGELGAVLFHGIPNAALCNAMISSQQKLQHSLPIVGLNNSIASQQELSFTVALDSVYLINQIKFQPYPENGRMDSLGFSYTLEISLNGVDWKMLIDYSKYTCYGVQSLALPVIAVGYLRFKLCKVVDSSVPFSLVLKECLLKEEHCAVIIRDNGIQVSTNYIKCRPIQEWSTDVYNQPVCMVKLRRPVFAKTIRFKLNTRSVQYTTNFGDIVFYVNDDQGECQTIKNVNLLDNTAPNEFPLTKEIVVSFINIKITNAIRMPSQVSATVDYTLTDLELKSE